MRSLTYCLLISLTGILHLEPPKETPLQKRILDATVMVLNNSTGLQGSGVVIKQEGNFLYVLTAGHIAKPNDDLVISSFNGNSRIRSTNDLKDCKVIAQAVNPDLAVIRIFAGKMNRLSIPICRESEFLGGQKISASSTGWDKTKGVHFIPVGNLASRVAKKPKYTEASKYWVSEREIKKGESGGPLIDQRGSVIGIASGVGDGKGYYTHCTIIHEFLKRNGLSYLMK